MRYTLLYSFFLVFIFGCTVEIAREAGKAIKSIDTTIQGKRDINIEKNNENKKKIKQKKLVQVNLIGKERKNLFSMLGKPSLIRENGKTISMRFDQKDCITYAYFNKVSNTNKVEYFELRTKNGELLTRKKDINRCLEKFTES